MTPGMSESEGAVAAVLPDLENLTASMGIDPTYVLMK